MNKTAINLQKLRTSRGLTQAEISEALNLEERTWKSYEYGTRNMPIQTLVSIANYFNVTTDYILGLDPHEKPQAIEFQKETGISESAIANISKYKENKAIIKCINQFLSSFEFLNAIENIEMAKAYNPGKNDKADIIDSVINGGAKFNILMGNHIRANTKVILAGDNLKEWLLWQSSQSINRLIERIVKGDKDNGTR